MSDSDPEPPPSKTAAVMKAVRDGIVSCAVGPGDRLPSIRAQAAKMAVSASTVVEAYNRLCAEGWIQARPGSGFYVARAVAPITARPAADANRIVDPWWVSRQALDGDPSVPQPGCGWLPPDWMPVDLVRRALRAQARGAAVELVTYGETRGSAPLRRLLRARLAADGVPVGDEHLTLTGSTSQALDLVARLLLRPGDTVLVDDPCYFNYLALLRTHRVRIVGVAQTPSGPDLVAFETVLAAARPKLYVTNAALQNPTGATLQAHVAHRLLTLAAAHDLTIIEDDVFHELESEPSPRLSALDGLHRVIRIGSFSKTLSASLRAGYVAARVEWIEALIDLQIATGFGGPGRAAGDAIARTLAGGGYRSHLDGLRQRLVRARRDSTYKLRRLGIEPWLQPRGGFYLWCHLPDGQAAEVVAKRALADGVVLAPGNVFSVSGSAPSAMRFNAAQCSATATLEVLARALAASA